MIRHVQWSCGGGFKSAQGEKLEEDEEQEPEAPEPPVLQLGSN